MKKPLLITTLAAGALLVGGTFAAYVITDNAAQKDVHIGIGNLIIDEDEPITLEWGDGTAIGDVEDLQPGAAKSVGKVVVKAVAEDTELVYDGRLDLQFEFEEGSKLDKYLTYHVYADNNGEIGEEIQAGNDGMFAVQGDAAGRTYHITVALGQPTDEDRIAISEDEATLYIDWKAAPAQEPAPQLLDTTFKVHAETLDGQGVYVVGDFSEWKAMEAYRLVWGEGDIWSGTIGFEEGEYEFKFVITAWDEKDIPENNGDYLAWIPAGDAANYVVVAGQTADYSGQQQEDPGEDPVSTVAYYLTGIYHGQENWYGAQEVALNPEVNLAFVLDEDKESQNYATLLGVEFQAGDKFKVVRQNGETIDWLNFGNESYPSDKDGNYLVEEEQTLNIYASKDGTIYVAVAE